MIESFGVASALGNWVMEVDADATGVAASGAEVPTCVTAVKWVGDEAVPTKLVSTSAREAAELVRAYFDGDLRALDAIGVGYRGSSFKWRVSQHMRGIGPGEVDSYAGLARRAGRPTAVRAVGTVCSKNAIPLIVPCHRVVRSDGSLGNYFYGVELKAALLRHEGGLR